MQLPVVLDLVAVGVFAVSGTLAAARKNLDYVGVIVIATVTAVGGGTLRDVLLDRHPIFWIGNGNALIVIVSAAAATLIYVHFRPPPDQLLVIPDAFGLAIYTIVGTQLTEDFGLPTSVAIALGTLTGTAGGVLRDILCNEVPLLFQGGYLYATASLVGASLYVLLEQPLGRDVAAYVGIVVVVVVRLVSVIYHWNMPKFKLDR
jgi:uncharacterized membrane protein YeiH